jgi:hypothetical protein
MPWWRLRQRERFARAVDCLPDAGQAPDPKLAGELAVVVMVRRSAAATAPTRDARDRMRATVLARLVGTEPEPTVAPSPVPRQKPAVPSRKPATRPERGVTGPRGRVAIAMAAAFCLLLVLSGMTLLLSRDALPGDPLYGVRRTVQSATLGLTSGDEAKGLKRLEFAGDTVGDLQTLTARHPDLRDSPIGDYLTAFADFDSDARAGTADLTGYATSHNDGVLSTLHDWAQQQANRIQQAQRTLPGPAELESNQSLALLDRIVRRADAIAARNACYTITSGSTDDLGVLPATGPCDKAPAVGSTLSTSGTPGAGGTIVGQVPPAPPAGDGSAPRSPVAPPTTTTFTPKTALPVPTGVLGPTVTVAPNTTAPGITLPLPLPGITVPPLLPGLPGLRIGQ